MKKYGVKWWYIDTFNDMYDIYRKGNFEKLIDAINYAINKRSLYSNNRIREVQVFEYEVKE